MDDIGFVYILSQQKENFLYELSKNKMHFEPIYETDVMLYPGGLTELYNFMLKPFSLSANSFRYSSDKR